MKLITFLLCIFICIPVTEPQINNLLIIWNVGQGQWVTLVYKHYCLHFDMGGEKYPQAVDQFCFQRKNRLHLSHIDWDHISFISRFSRRMKYFCLHKPVREKIDSRRKQFLARTAICSRLPDIVQELDFPTEGLKRNNDLSRVFVADQVLFPGDSTKTAERRWAKQLSSKLQILLVGHHGSQTSTGNVLLMHLSELKQAIVSARKQKYGHPHYSVRLRLKQSRIPVLNTEHWGHLSISLQEF